MFQPETKESKVLGSGFILREPSVADVVAWQTRFADKLDGLADASKAAAEFVCLMVFGTDGSKSFADAADVLKRLTFKQLKATKEECLQFCGLAEDPEDAAKN